MLSPFLVQTKKESDKQNNFGSGARVALLFEELSLCSTRTTRPSRLAFWSPTVLRAAQHYFRETQITIGALGVSGVVKNRLKPKHPDSIRAQPL